MSEYKTCTGCKSSLLLSAFGVHNGTKAAKSGLRSRCKQCESAAYKIYRANNRNKVLATKRNWEASNKDKKAEMDRRYRLKNLEKLATYHKSWRVENAEYLREYKRNLPENQKEAKRLSDRIYNKNNRDKNLIATRKYRANNPEKTKQSSKKWRDANRQALAVKASKRRATKRNNGVYFISQREIKKLYQQNCFYCSASGPIDLDHVIPISRGGTHSIGNLVASCAFCNRSKSSKTIMEWRLWREQKTI